MIAKNATFTNGGWFDSSNPGAHPLTKYTHWNGTEFWAYESPDGALYGTLNNRWFTLDSKEPTDSYLEFLDGEVRYNTLKMANPDKAARLQAKSEQEAKERYQYLSRLTALYAPEE